MKTNELNKILSDVLESAPELKTGRFGSGADFACAVVMQAKIIKKLHATQLRQLEKYAEFCY